MPTLQEIIWNLQHPFIPPPPAFVGPPAPLAVSGGSSSSSSGGGSTSSQQSTVIPSAPNQNITNLFYNPLEQLIAKTNPELAKKMYLSRTGVDGETTTQPSSGGVVSPSGGTKTPIIPAPSPFVPYTPFEQAMAKINPNLAITLYEKRTGISVQQQPVIDLKSMLLQGPSPRGAYQKEPGGPVYIMSDEENALINAQRDIKPTLAFQHGVTITDQDYGSEISRLSADITSGQGSVQSERQWLQDYKTYEQGINQNIATIRGGPSDARWEIDINQDKKIDSNEVFTSQQAIDYFQGELTSATETKQKVEENIPLMESDIRSMKESKIYLEEYQRKGYYFDVKNGEYIFTEPKASDVVEKLYGNRPDLYIASELRTLGFGVLFAGGQQLITGAPSLEAQKEATAESILGATRLPGESIETHAVRFWTSPEAIADVWVPVATLGLSKGATLLGRVVGPSLISAGSKLAGEVGPTGARLISGGKMFVSGAGKVLSQPIVQYGMKYGMYGALEAPILIDIAQNQPEMFGATLGKSLFRWEVAWGAMDIGFARKHQILSKTPVDEELFVGTPVTEDVFMRDIQKKIQTSGPQVFIGEERKLAEFGIKPKYTILEKGQQGMAEVKIREFKGVTPGVAGEPRTSFTGYIVTSDKPVVLQTGERAQRWWGEASSELHPSLTPGEEIFVSKERSLVFGTTATRIETKASLFTKQERTVFSEFKGISEEPMETAYHYRTPRLEEPGITTKSYISELTIKPRSGEALTVTGLGESRQGYPALFSEMNKNKLIITEGTRAKTEFIGEISPRIGPQYEKQFVKEYGDVFSKTKAGTGVETGISGGEISVIKPTQASLLTRVEEIEIKVSKGLSGGTGVLKLLAEKETTKVVEKIGAPKGATAGGMLLSQTAEEETITYVRSPYARTQGLTQETEYISQQWNEQRPRQGTRTLTLTGVTLETLVGTGELNINERDQFTREISGLGLKQDVGFEELTKPDFGMRTFQDIRTDLMQSSRQEQQSLTRMDQATDLITTTPVESPTPTYVPGGIHIRPPRLFRRKKDDEEEKKYYKPVKRQRDLLKKSHKTRTKGLTADILSVTQSQARYGKSTQPRLTKQLWEESEKTLFKRVPTEELLKGGRTKADNLIGGKNNKGGKKNVYY